jgi:phosphoglycolate phosphatase-like HAD superfamily hydrolase
VLERLYGVRAEPDKFIPYGGMGEARFLGGVAEKYGVQAFDVSEAKRLFLEIYVETYCQGPNAGDIAFQGAVALVRALRAAGLATAVASSAARVKVKSGAQGLKRAGEG